MVSDASMNQRVVCTAVTGCGPDDGLEDARQIGWRGRDHAQDLAGGRLLLQRFSQRPVATRCIGAESSILRFQLRDPAYGSSAITFTSATLPCCATAPG